MERKRDYSINREAVKALVAVYGAREAARQCGMKECTVLKWCSRYKWRKAEYIRPKKGVWTKEGGKVDDAGTALVRAMEKSKEASQLHLAKYTENASKKAAEHKDPLEVARKVRDVAGVFSILYPPQEQEGLIEGAILLGSAKVTDNPEEIMARAVMVPEKGDVREELSDQRPAGD